MSIRSITCAAALLLAGRINAGANVQLMGMASKCLPKEDFHPSAIALATGIAVNTAPVFITLSK